MSDRSDMAGKRTHRSTRQGRICNGPCRYCKMLLNVNVMNCSRCNCKICSARRLQLETDRQAQQLTTHKQESDDRWIQTTWNEYVLKVPLKIPVSSSQFAASVKCKTVNAISYECSSLLSCDCWSSVPDSYDCILQVCCNSNSVSYDCSALLSASYDYNYLRSVVCGR